MSDLSHSPQGPWLLGLVTLVASQPSFAFSRAPLLAPSAQSSLISPRISSLAASELTILSSTHGGCESFHCPGAHKMFITTLTNKHRLHLLVRKNFLCPWSPILPPVLDGVPGNVPFLLCLSFIPVCCPGFSLPTLWSWLLPFYSSLPGPRIPTGLGAGRGLSHRDARLTG